VQGNEGGRASGAAHGYDDVVVMSDIMLYVYQLQDPGRTLGEQSMLPLPL
jgi:hypothetical protein